MNVFILPSLVEELFFRDTTGEKPAALELLIDEVEKRDWVVSEGKKEGFFERDQSANPKTALVGLGGSHPWR